MTAKNNHQGSSNRNSSSRRHRSSSNKQKDQASSSNDIMSPTPYTNTSSQSPPTRPNRLTATKTQAAGDSITNDDLEAMKAMIGDIKKDPSLLYRLSNLSGSPNDKQHHGGAPTNMTANNNNRGPSAVTNSSPRNSGAASPSFRGSLTIMDDNTEVSSIGMMSSDDYNSYLHPNHGGGGGNNSLMMMGGNNIHHSNEFANACVAGVVVNNSNSNTTTPSKHGMNNTNEQGGTMSPTVMMASPNQSRTNRDAEIALRMQSLRAMRDWNKQQQQQGSGGGGRKGSPTNIANGGNGGGSASAAVTSPPSNSGSRGETTNDHEDHSSQQQQQTQSLPPPIQSPPPPTDTKTSSSSSRRREGKSSSSSNGGGGGGSKSSKSRSRRKDSTNSHRNVDKNHSSNGDDRRSSRNDDQEEDSSSQVVDDMYNDPNDMMSELYAPQRRNHHGDGGGGGGGGMENFLPQSLEEQLDQQQHELSERTLRRISEATTETSTTNLTTASSSFVRKGSGKSHGGGGSPRGNGRSSSKRGGGGGGGSGRPGLGQRSASHGSYISGSQSVQDGHYHQRQQQQYQQQPNPSSPSSTKYGRRNTHDPPSPSKQKHSFHETSPYSRRNTTHNDESFSSPSKHSFHESSTSHRRRNTAASEQGMYSRSYSYSDDHRIHGGVYDGRVQQHPHQQQQQQHSHPPQDHHRRSQSFSVNDQNNYQYDHSGSSEDRSRSYQVHQLAKLYARGGTPEKNNSDGRGDATAHSVDEHSVPSSRVSSSSYEEEGRHHHRHNNHQHHSQQQPLSNRKGRRQQRFSMNDGMIDDKSTNQYDTPQKHSASDNNLEVNAKAKSKSMIITHRDAAESISPRRKSKKSSKKSSSRGGSDEKKKSKRSSKSKVQDVPSSESKDSLNPVSPTSESMRLSLQSSESSGLVYERAPSPGKKSSFHGRIRRFTRQASTDLSTSSSGVRDRLSNPLRSLKSPSKDRASPQSGSGHQDDPSEPVRRLTLDSTNVSDHSSSPQKQRKNKLMSRLVSSPTQLDNCGSISIADDDDDQAVSTGIELALMTGDVPRLCDAKGRCLFHPHIRLQKPKLFGGWKILFKHCPDCAVEHMRATQDKMAEKKKKKRRERKSDEKKRSEEKKKSDPIIEMNVGDDDFTPKKSKKKKRKPRDDGDKREEPKVEPLALPSPAPPREEDDQTEVSDAITNYDPPYQESRAIVEHKPPRSKKVNGLPWSDYNGQSGRYTGEVNEQYLPHGRGEMVYDKGIVSAGIWYNGVLDTEEPVSMDGYVPNRLSNYEVGDKGSDEDMIIASKRETAAAVAQLRVNDAAFVRRSDGSWTYAVMKDQVDDGRNRSIRFKVNTRGSTKSFPPSQWGTYIRCINSRTEINANRRSDAQPKRSALGLGEYLDSNNRRSAQPSGHSSHSLAGNFTGYSGDISVSSTHSAPVLDRNRSNDNLTTAKMRIKSRSRSRGRKNVTTLPLLFSSSMSVSEEAEDDTSDEWQTASGSGYRLRGIDP